MQKKYNLKLYNFILFFLVLAVMIIGVLVVDSVDEEYTIKQLVGVILAVIVMIVVSFVDYHMIARLAFPIYIFGTVLLALVLIAGSSVNNAKRWFTIAGITFQPSELAKILMIIFMAAMLSKLKEDEKVNSIRGIFGFLFFWVIPIFLIYKEPDLSTTLCLTMVLFTMLYLSGLSYKLIGIVLLVAIPTFSAFIWYVQQPDQKISSEIVCSKPVLLARMHQTVFCMCGNDLCVIIKNYVSGGRLRPSGGFFSPPKTPKKGLFLMPKT